MLSWIQHIGETDRNRQYKRDGVVVIRKVTAYLAAIAFILAWLPVPSATAARQDLQGKIVILDAGHGLGSNNVYAGYDEQATMLKLAQHIKPLLEARGATVQLTRPTQRFVELPVRSAKINQWALQVLRRSDETDRLLGVLQSIIDDPDTFAPIYLNAPYDWTFQRKIHPDLQRIFELENDPVIRERFLVISLHSNATPNPIDPSVHGADVFHISNNFKENMNYYTNYSNEHRSNYFGRQLLNRISKLGIRSRGTGVNNYHIIREHNLPAVLVENGFHTNPQDRAKLLCDDFLKKLASAYADAITDYFNTYQEPSPGTVPRGRGSFPLHSVPIGLSRLLSFVGTVFVVHSVFDGVW
jgi:N-acetylmuramoyl-L-alanine amidase